MSHDEEIASLTARLRAAESENAALRAIQGISVEQCLSCGGDGGHNEGCQGTTALMLLTERASALARELEGVRADAERYRAYRDAEYQNLVAHAKLFGPQMTWPTAEQFAESYDEKIDAVIEARALEADHE